MRARSPAAVLECARVRLAGGKARKGNVIDLITPTFDLHSKKITMRPGEEEGTHYVLCIKRDARPSRTKSQLLSHILLSHILLSHI